MEYYRLEQYRVYHHYRARELYRVADRKRLAKVAFLAVRPARMRFYYPTIARFGEWLMIFGQRLQKRYGELCNELPASTTAPRPAGRHVS